MIFKKALIWCGKLLPFIFVYLLLVGYLENIHSILFGVITTTNEGDNFFYTPLSDFISEFVYIDWIDVLLLYVLCSALELCWRTFMCVHVISLNLAFRTLLERFYIQDGIVIGIITFLALCAIFCVWNGIKIYLTKKLLKQ